MAQLANVLEAIVSQRLIRKLDGQGRALATEVMRMNHGLRTCIRERKVEQIVGLIEIGQGEGMHTIDESLEQLLHSGQISLEETQFNCRDHRRFKS